MRFYWEVLRSITPVIRSFLECFAFGSRPPCASIGRFCVRLTPVSFPLSGKERRLAECCVPIPRGSGSPLVRSRMSCGYRACLVHFGLVRFFAAIPTENEGTQRRGERSRRRGVSTFLREPFSLAMLSAGSTLGLRAPNLRQRAIGSLDSLHLIRGRVPLAKHHNTRYL